MAQTLSQRGTPYPLHIGVTEAGDGEDGRIQALPALVLFADGIGDTVRVSLTEEPEAEIPVGNELCEDWQQTTLTTLPAIAPALPVSYRRRNADIVRWHEQLPIGVSHTIRHHRHICPT